MSKFYFKDFELLVPDSVYFPREDSLLLAEAVKKGACKNKFCLDLGCGSGIQSLNLLSQGARKVVAVDLNLKALAATKFNLEKYAFKEKINFELIESNLFERINEKFDLIVFNPPYVISDLLEDRAVDGGKKGRKVLDLFLNKFPNYLTSKGIVFFLQTDFNEVKETEEKLRTNFDFEVVGREKLFFEELLVVKAWKNSC